MPEADQERTTVIVNPNSAGGRTGRVWTRIRPILESAAGAVDVFETNASGDGIELTADAFRSGCRRFIAVGGDGTLNEVVNGLFIDGPPDPEVTLGLIPHGTGSDFRRTVELPLDPEAAVQIIENFRTKPTDVMRVDYIQADDTAATRYAINLASFGMGGAVAARVNRSSKPFGARIAFLTAFARTAIGFKGDRVSLEVHDEKWSDILITNVAIGNGQFHGAGMRICPRAAIDDGLLDVTIVEKLSLWEIVRNATLVFNGRIYDHPKIHHRRTRGVVATCAGRSAIEIDGEPLGYLPLAVTVIPNALKFIVP